jgi:c-di-GMP-binding flagellar brake protein YcgR
MKKEVWDIEAVAIEKPEDRLPRGFYVIPCLLHDKATKVHIKGVILDLSATGCRVFTNDKRVRVMDAKRLMSKTFDIEFDFHDVDTGGIEGRVRRVMPGKDPLSERQLGLEFTEITQLVKRDINRGVQGDINRDKAGKRDEHKPSSPPGARDTD